MRPSEGRVTGSIPVGGATFWSYSMQAPSDIIYHSRSRILEIIDFDGTQLKLSAEYLRVMSPSAEVQGHTPDQAQLQVGKQDVCIVGIEPVGTYAIRIIFSDGHDSGYYDWDYLRLLYAEKDRRWQDYLKSLEMQGFSRDPDDPKNISHLKPRKACHH